MTHTKEPWSVTLDRTATGHPFGVITGGGSNGKASDLICESPSSIDFPQSWKKFEVNARRIVACVNACEGIQTEQLEFDGAAFIALLKEREVFKQQRDELVAALEHIANESVRNLGSARIIARSALAKVGGKEQTT